MTRQTAASDTSYALNKLEGERERERVRQSYGDPKRDEFHLQIGTGLVAQNLIYDSGQTISCINRGGKQPLNTATHVFIVLLELLTIPSSRLSSLGVCLGTIPPGITRGTADNNSGSSPTIPEILSGPVIQELVLA